MDVKANYLIKEIKNTIFHHEGYPNDKQRLIFAGSELQDDSTLSDYNIIDMSTINLVVEVQEMDISFKFMSGLKVKLNVQPNNLIKEIKNKIFENQGYHTDQHILIFSGKELKDACTLSRL